MALMHTPSISSRGRSAWTLLLVLALLWAQALGLAHRALHASVTGGGAVPAAAKLLLPDDVSPVAGLLAHLLGGNAGDPDCHLYDQLGPADSLTMQPQTLPALPQLSFLSPVVVPLAFSFFCLAFQARAPPAVR